MSTDERDESVEIGQPASVAAVSIRSAEKTTREKRPEKSLDEKRVYEAGAVIVCDGKVVLRLTDKQRWIFPKGKLKKRESPQDAAVREAIEETGLKVEVIEQVGDLLVRADGKKRRFVFYLMRATAKTWDWPHHEGRDTFLIAPDRVASLVRHAGYSSVWEACRARVMTMCTEPTPFVAHLTAAGDGQDSPDSEAGRGVLARAQWINASAQSGEKTSTERC